MIYLWSTSTSILDILQVQAIPLMFTVKVIFRDGLTRPDLLFLPLPRCKDGRQLPRGSLPPTGHMLS